MAQIDLHKLDVHETHGVSRIGKNLVTLTLQDEGCELVLFFGGDATEAAERIWRLRCQLALAESEVRKAIPNPYRIGGTNEPLDIATDDERDPDMAAHLASKANR